FAGGKIGNRFNVDTLDKSLRRDQQLDRTKDSAIVGPIAGTSSRQHVIVEGTIHTHRDRIGLAPAEELRDVEGKSRVTLAGMFSGEPAIDPHHGGMEYSFKLDSHRGMLPSDRNIEGPPIPGDAAIVDRPQGNLPGMRHNDDRCWRLLGLAWTGNDKDATRAAASSD